MIFLTSAQVLFIHDQVIKRTGGSHGLRDTSLLESAIHRPQATFENDDLYPSLFNKTAALLHSLLKNHPFIDGNKRTAFSACGIFLKLNGYILLNEHGKSVEFTLAVEKDELSLEEIASWLETHASQG